MGKPFKVLGINSGIGVSLHPFKENLVGNLEIRQIFHSKDELQWKNNFNNTPLLKIWEECKEKIGIFSEIDLIISSPDCGSGSVLRMSRGKSYGDHKKNKSLSIFLRSVKYYKPKLILFENLEGLFKSYPEQEFKEKLKDYHLVIHITPVSSFGNSQTTRKRLIIVGIRLDMLKRIYPKWFELPKHIKPVPCYQLYGDLKKEDYQLGHVREDINSVISIHARRRMSLKEIKEEWNGRLKGETRWKVVGGSFSTAPGVYRNMNNETPCTARLANRQFDESGNTLTPRQLARVQGVPDEFKIHIEKENKLYWINKGRAAVTKSPPYEISVWFKEQLIKHNIL